MSNTTNKITVTLTKMEATLLAEVLRLASENPMATETNARWAAAFASGLESQVKIQFNPDRDQFGNKLLFNTK